MHLAGARYSHHHQQRCHHRQPEAEPGSTICGSTIVFYLRERRDQINVLLHSVFPTLAILILLAPLYYQFAPLPDYPVRLGNYFAILWIVLGLVTLGFAAARRPQAIAQAEDVFVEDEPADPRNR